MPRIQHTPREYANMHLIYGECKGNANAAAALYRERYPNVCHPDYHVFIRVHNCYSEGRMPGGSVGGTSTGRITRSDVEDAVLEEIERDPSTSTRATRLARRTGLFRNTMGKDEKEDSGFGFKDRAKAEETLRLLESHDVNYRRLTVRGLLGRAKRVLSMTKAEEKIKNIKEAMEVFEKWLADLSLDKEKKDNGNKRTDNTEKKERENNKEENNHSDKDSSSDVEMDEKEKKPEKQSLPPDTVPGLGFKDTETAEATLKELEGRDPDYQKLAIKGLIGRAKRVLTCTRDETKLSNIKSAISIFEQFLDDFDTKHMSRQNNPYLSLGLVRTAEKMAGDDVTEQQKSFIAAYSSVRGEYKRLRTVTPSDGDKTWDIVRNAALKELKEKHAEAKLFNEKDEPTKEHLQMLLWAYSPEQARVKKCIPETKEDEEEEDSGRKRKSSAREDEPAKKSKE